MGMLITMLNPNPNLNFNYSRLGMLLPSSSSSPSPSSRRENSKSSSSRHLFKPLKCASLQRQQVQQQGGGGGEVESGRSIMCQACDGKGWLLCHFCNGQKTNVKAPDSNRIYRRCPSCRAIGYLLCPNCKVFKCVTFPNYNDCDDPSL